MALLNRFTLWHWLAVIVAISIVVFILVYSPKAHARSSPYVIQHHNSVDAARQSLSQSNRQSRALRDAQGAESRARQEIDRARNDLNRAYRPRSPMYAPSRHSEILRAQSELDRANRNLETINNRIYDLKRKKHIQDREIRLSREYKRLKKQESQLRELQSRQGKSLNKNPKGPQD